MYIAIACLVAATLGLGLAAGAATHGSAQLELLAPASGRLRILTAPETVIGRSHVLGTIEPA